MAWIELHQAIWTHKKTLILAAELDLEELYAAAHMAKLWTWALDNAQDGNLSGLPFKVIAYGAGWHKDPELFVRAAIKSGWLDEIESGLFIHDWDEYAGKLMERRAAERERSRKRRASAKSPCDDQEATGGRPENDQQTAVGTVPNLTVPYCSSNSKTGELENEQVAAEEKPASIYTAFEKEFGRPLSPMEIEQIKQWGKEHADIIILEALKRAVMAGSLKFRFIDTILIDWKKNNIRSTQEIIKHEAVFKSRGDPKKPRPRELPPEDKKRKELVKKLYLT